MAAMIWCPFPDHDHARSVAKSLLKENLIACANILGPMESLYMWEGESHSDEEVGVLFKTSHQLVDECVERLAVLHRYVSPAIMAWECEGAHPSTREWLGSLGA